MRVAIGIAAAVLLLSAGSADASDATQVSPLQGSDFSTTDVVTFSADIGTDDRDHVIVFSDSAKVDAEAGGLTSGDTSGEEEVDLGWLALKFDHLGTFSWSVCPMVKGPQYDEVLLDECSPSWTFSVRFRLPTVTRAQARSDARYVMNRKFRSYWRSGYNRRVSCSSVTRTRQRCKVSVNVGDSLVWGRVTVYAKRHRTWALDHYYARINIYDEYCHLVNRRPLRECLTTRRRSGSVY